MKINHKVPGVGGASSIDPVWSEKVEREAARTTDQAEVRYRKAERRLARAVERAEREAARPEVGAVKVARLWRVVDQRRDELAVLDRLMRESPAGSQHRGVGSYRGVPE